MIVGRGLIQRIAHDPLLALAAATASPDVRWLPGQRWTSARNAHETNSAMSLVRALRSDANWLEGDLRRDERRRLVMAHDVHDVGWGVTFERWLEIGAASGRGVKIDLKDPGAFRQMLDAVAASGIDESRLIFNVPVAGRPDLTLTDAQLRELRRRFPRATVNLSPTGLRAFTRDVVDELARTARVVGGAVMFPLQWDLLRDDVIQALRPFGRIAVWSSPIWGTPADPAGEALELRRRGVDGMVDLADPSHGARLVAMATRALAAVFGRQALFDARDAVTKLLS